MLKTTYKNCLINTNININNIFPSFIGGKPKYSDNVINVLDKFHFNKYASVSLASNKDVKKAITLAYESRKTLKNIRAYERKSILVKIANEIRANKETFANILCIEAGKPIRDSRVEVQRSINTFELAAEESIRFNGEYISSEMTKSDLGYQYLQKRFPIGLVSMISPFNFPLNLVAHKIAPAIATGCPFILKPSLLTPISAMLIGEILTKTNLPKESFSILVCKDEDANLLVTDHKINLFSFTGSPKIGWMLKNQANKKKVVLELGGNAACIIDKNIDINNAVERVTMGAFYQSGQSCISVQRLYIHSDIFDNFIYKLKSKMEEMLKVGDPFDETTYIGPMISENEAKRCMDWINEAINKGANVLFGGTRNKNFMEATLVQNVSKGSKLLDEEVFGPICVVEKFDDYKLAIQKANDSKFGLQTGVFTNDINKAFYAYKELEVGAVVINDVPSKRIDAMPYGGIKDSGIGREGVKSAMEEMTELKLMVMKSNI